MNMQLTTKEAIKYVLDNTGMSKYALARRMEVTANMIDHYLSTTRMRKPTAKRFKRAFNIQITDVFDPTEEAMNRN